MKGNVNSAGTMPVRDVQVLLVDGKLSEEKLVHMVFHRCRDNLFL
jgi:hypothetical protein